MGIQTLAKNSMRFFCLLFWLALPLVITETLLLETHDETDLNDVGSNDEVERVKQQVGQDYGQGLGHSILADGCGKGCTWSWGPEKEKMCSRCKYCAGKKVHKLCKECRNCAKGCNYIQEQKACARCPIVCKMHQVNKAAYLRKCCMRACQSPSNCKCRRAF